MHEKRSAVILKELVEVTGGDPWGQLKLEATAAGLQVPLVAGEENEDRVVERPTRIPLPTAFQTIQKMKMVGQILHPEAEREQIPIPPTTEI